MADSIIVGYLSDVNPRPSITLLEEKIGKNAKFKRRPYLSRSLMMSALAHKEIHYIVVDVTEESELIAINKYISQHILVFQSWHKCVDISAKSHIYHIYK